MSVGWSRIEWDQKGVCTGCLQDGKEFNKNKNDTCGFLLCLLVGVE